MKNHKVFPYGIINFDFEMSMSAQIQENKASITNIMNNRELVVITLKIN